MTEALFLETAQKEGLLKEQQERRLNVSGVLKILGVSRNGYLSWKKRLPPNREKRKQSLKERILELYHDSHQNYGAPKIAECLRQEGERIAEKTVGNYMRELGIKAQYIRSYAVWCSDITYIWKFEGFVYLSSIMDLYSRKIISWVLSDTLEAEWVIQALEKAKRSRKVDKPLVLHTDYTEEKTIPKFYEFSYKSIA